MKILLVSQEYPPETAHGGIGTQTYTKALGLSELGHEIFILSHSRDGLRHEINDSGVHIIRIPGMDNSINKIDQWITDLSNFSGTNIRFIPQRTINDVTKILESFHPFGGIRREVMRFVTSYAPEYKDRIIYI